jgi:hypothetical protein
MFHGLDHLIGEEERPIWLIDHLIAIVVAKQKSIVRSGEHTLPRSPDRAHQEAISTRRTGCIG